MKHIGAPSGSYLSVVKLLRDILEAKKAEVAFESSAGIKTGCGRKLLIVEARQLADIKSATSPGVFGVFCW
jgi:hypothetical protein